MPDTVVSPTQYSRETLHSISNQVHEDDVETSSVATSTLLNPTPWVKPMSQLMQLKRAQSALRFLLLTKKHLAHD